MCNFEKMQLLHLCRLWESCSKQPQLKAVISLSIYLSPKYFSLFLRGGGGTMTACKRQLEEQQHSLSLSPQYFFFRLKRRESMSLSLFHILGLKTWHPRRILIQQLISFFSRFHLFGLFGEKIMKGRQWQIRAGQVILPPASWDKLRADLENKIILSFFLIYEYSHNLCKNGNQGWIIICSQQAAV
jgi:hypothetical protein